MATGINHAATCRECTLHPCGRDRFSTEENRNTDAAEIKPFQRVDPQTLTLVHQSAARYSLLVDQIEFFDRELVVIQHIDQHVADHAGYTDYRYITGLAHGYSLTEKTVFKNIRNMRRNGSAAPQSN